MGTRGVLAIVAVLAVVSIVAGCGGGDSGTTTDAISKAAFIKKADAICKRGTERMQRKILAVLRTKNGIRKPRPSESKMLVGEIIVPSVRTEVQALRALEIPAGDEDRVEAMIGALEEGLETAEDSPQAVASSSDVVFGIASRIAGEYGLTDCGAR
jgi:hypothetical protein